MRTRLSFLRQDLRPADFGRADIALFVGRASRRRGADGTAPAPVPQALARWWRVQRGWPVDAPARLGDAPRDTAWLLNVPVPIESLDEFEALFLSDRPVADDLTHGAPLRVPSPLAVAVRAFFAHGGQRCLVVRTGEALAYGRAAELIDGTLPALFVDDEGDGDAAAAAVSALPGLGAGDTSTPPGWAQWRGLQHAYGLPEASFVCVPDLPEAFATPVPPPQPPRVVGAPQERFQPCVTAAAAGPDLVALRLLAAPALAAAGFTRWRGALAHALALLHGRSAAVNRRDMALVASLPLSTDAVGAALGLQPRPEAGARLEGVLADWLAVPADADDFDGADLRHAQLQLVWPWLRTDDSVDGPQGLEAPEGAFAGTLAAGALRFGSFRSLALQPLARVRDTVPRLPAADAHRPLAIAGLTGRDETLAERLTLAALDLGGWRWISDRTTAEDARLAIAPLRRLIAQLARWARRLGNDFVHEPSNEATWFRVRVALQALGRQLFAAGALDGTSADTAFVVTCDRRTMSQDDIDAGRLVAAVTLQPALPVERITVTLVLTGGTPVRPALQEAA